MKDTMKGQNTGRDATPATETPDQLTTQSVHEDFGTKLANLLLTLGVPTLSEIPNADELKKRDSTEVFEINRVSLSSSK